MNSRMTKKSGAVNVRLLSAILAALMALVLIGLNLLAGLLPWSVHSAAFSYDPIFGLTSSSRATLSELDEDVTIYMLCENGEIGADRDLLAFLKNYETISDRISVYVVDTNTEIDFLALHGIYSLEEGEIAFLVKSDRRHTLVSLNDLIYYRYTGSNGQSDFSVSLSDFATIYSQTYAATPTPYFNGEEGITNAIRLVTRDSVPVIAVVQASQLLENGSSLDINYHLAATFLQSLRQNGCDVRYVSSVSQLTSEHDILLYSSPFADLTNTQAADLALWLAAGGDMILSTYSDAAEQPNLLSVMEMYGLTADAKGIRVADGNKAYGGSALHIPHVESTHAITSKLTESLLVNSAHAIYVTEKTGVTVTSLLHTSDQGYREQYDSETGKWGKIEEDAGVYSYGVVAQKGDTDILWLGSPYLLDLETMIVGDSVFTDLTDTYAEDGNYLFAMNAIDWMSGGKLETIDFEGRSMSSAFLSADTTSIVIWTGILVVLIPLAFALLGVFRRYVRRKN